MVDAGPEGLAAEIDARHVRGRPASGGVVVGAQDVVFGAGRRRISDVASAGHDTAHPGH